MSPSKLFAPVIMSISLQNVSKSFGAVPAIDDVSVEIGEGEFFAVLGPSGCGKSTLLRLIAGLEQLDTGQISVAGSKVAGEGLHLPPENRNVGVVFQSYALWPHMTVRQNVAFPVEGLRLSKAEQDAWIRECLATVALSEFAERRPAELSGGQRQRVALARCLAQRAETILMDEPLANLDPHLRTVLEDELASFHRTTGTTTLYITHDQREAMALADRVAIMWQGRILQVDKPELLYRRPASEQVARFIGRGAILTATIEAAENGKARLRAGGHFIEAACNGHTDNGTARLLIRPEDVSIGEDGIPARLSRTTYRGGHWEAVAEIEGFDSALLVQLPAKPAEGDRCRLRITSGWVVPEQTGMREAA